MQNIRHPHIEGVNNCLNYGERHHVGPERGVEIIV